MALQERYDRTMVHQATLFVLQSNFKEALRVGNEFLTHHMHNESWRRKGPLSYFQTTLPLTTPLLYVGILGEEDEQGKMARSTQSLSTISTPKETTASTTTKRELFFEVRLGTQLTAVDEMATLVLQCWYELRKMQLADNPRTHGHHWDIGTLSAADQEAWRHLWPVLEMYSIHPMPIQLFTELWIRFWHQSSSSLFSDLPLLDDGGGPNVCSLSWGVQVAVLLVEYCARHPATPPLLQDLRDELVEFVLTEQVPQLSSGHLIQQITGAILTKKPKTTTTKTESWEPLLLQIKEHVLVRDRCRRPPSADETRTTTASLRILQSCLQEHLTKKEEACPLLVPPVLLERMLQHKCFQNLPLDEIRALRPTVVTTLERTTTLPIVISLQRLSTALQAGWQSFLPTSIQTLMDRLRHYCHYTTTMLFSSLIDNPKDIGHAHAIQQQQQFRSYVALSLASLLLTWRHRQGVGRWGKALSMALLAPIMEVVDALRTHPDEDP